MLRYLPGLILIQLVAVGLLHVNARAEPMDLLVRAGLPCAVVTLVMALWFATLSRSQSDQRHAALIEAHAREREQLKVEAVEARERVQVDALQEREKVQVAARREQDKAVDKIRREAEKRERRVSRGASLKLGLTFFTTAGLGVLMLLTELLTLGLLTLSTSAGALGGYLLRWRQTRQLDDDRAQRLPDTAPRIVADSSVLAIEAPPRTKDPA